MADISPSLILLTYKGKVLLMRRQKSVIDQEAHPWSFIGGFRQKKETFQQALSRRVEKEAGIKVEDIEFVSDYCYFAKLTDDNVNKIKRDENQLLDFFNAKEVEKLFLSGETAKFMLNHSNLIKLLDFPNTQ